MYNRYIASPDGTFEKSRVPEKSAGEELPKFSEREAPDSGEATSFSAPPENRRLPPPSAAGMLRQLIPQNLDTGDLLVIAMMLLMGGDKKDSSALLTLLFYLFL